MAKKKGMITMVLPILSSKVTEGTTKEGRRYHWCSLWVPLEDGTIYEVRSDTEYPRGANVEFALESKFGKLDLVPIGFAKEQ